MGSINNKNSKVKNYSDKEESKNMETINLDTLVPSAKKATVGSNWKASTIKMYNDVLGSCIALADDVNN